jgi:hypothetical protein
MQLVLLPNFASLPLLFEIRKISMSSISQNYYEYVYSTLTWKGHWETGGTVSNQVVRCQLEILNSDLFLLNFPKTIRLGPGINMTDASGIDALDYILQPEILTAGF